MLHRTLRSPWTRAAALAVVAVGVGSVVHAAVTDDADAIDGYCATVAEQRAAVGQALAAGPTTGLIRALPSFERLEAAAPADIADEWARVNGAVGDLVDALDDAGVDPSTYRRDDPPVGLSRADRAAIDAAAAALGAPGTQAAMAAVEQQARDVCRSPLSL
ncbi:hypothetical protein E8D34_16705 [Nocardioides sp. GY 10113]|uniref:hypothetical protein n=1 Tax=Nocardioides sp. GY 10113 TaxID=2569761 RepID=UPI0010A7B723|nr:hypothetical protein [Nocardioides sp. GY 10113]TIC80380.1 hypothetical protein E8D34_19275 [Nocardioides sp. GY 10113]TIC82459.1 hypothetical protein E8D34_16705 [Nocardioides sp. GY 10113]